METEHKILNHFLAHNAPITIRQLAKRIGSYPIVHRAATRLVATNALHAQQVGNAKQLTLVPRLSTPLLLVEARRQERILHNKNLSILRNAVLEAAGPHCTILLFGSYAKGTQTKHSDIDLLIVLPDNRKEDAVEEALRLIPSPTHPIIMDARQFQQMRKTTEGNVVHEAMQHNVILHGIESYYRLLA